MAEHVTEFAGFAAPSNARLRSLIIPREHGAWGMLLVPLATGAAVGLLNGGRAWFLPSLIVATLSIFWLRTPVESWLGTTPMRAQSREERSTVAKFIFLLAGVAALAFTGLFWGGQHLQLLWIGAVCTKAFVAQAVLKKLGRKTRALTQIVGSIGLTSTAPAAYYVVTGRMNVTALLLWVCNWLFAVNQIQFVQLRIHSARVSGFMQKFTHARSFLITQFAIALLLFLAFLIHVSSWLVLLAFAPALVRGLAWFFRESGPLVVRRLGWTELANGITFGVLIVAGFSIHL